MKSFNGEITDGIGWHSCNMEQWNDLPFSAYPGTLNLWVGLDVVQKVVALMPNVIYALDREWPYVLGTLNGVEVAVTNSGNEPKQLELLSTVRLRDLGLVNGDIVTVFI